MYWDGHRAEYMTSNRMMNPRTGRWSSPDPFFHVRNGNLQSSRNAMTQAGNLYMFVMHNPVRFTDPTGLFAQCPMRDAARNLSLAILEHLRGNTSRSQVQETKRELVSLQVAIMTERVMILSTGSHAPYTQFLTKENAVLAWSLTFIPLSGPDVGFPHGSEWGSWIHRARDEDSDLYRYWFDTPRRGDVYVPFERRTPATAVAAIHTHPWPSSAGIRSWGEHFSVADGRFANSRELPLYLATPGWDIRRLCPNWSDVTAWSNPTVIPNTSRYVTTIFEDLRRLRR